MKPPPGAGLPGLDPGTALLLVLPPLFWAGNAVLARTLVGEVPPLLLSFLRWAVAIAVFVPFAGRACWQARAALRAQAGRVALIGFLGVGCYNTLQYLALQTSTPINVTLIASSTPVFVLLIGVLFYREHPGRAQWAGAALSGLGVLWVLSGGDPARLAGLRLVAGDLVMLAANLSWGLYTWQLRRHRPQLPFAVFLMAQMVTGLAAIAPFAAAEALWPGGPSGPAAWRPTTPWIVLYMAVLPSLVAYAVWDRGVARAGAVVPVYFANLTPVFAALMSALLLDQPPQGYHGVGLLLILLGIHLASRAMRAPPRG